jgi:hypothetical protein
LVGGEMKKIFGVEYVMANPVAKYLSELSGLYAKKAEDYAGEEQYRNFKLTGAIWNVKPSDMMLQRAAEKMVRIATVGEKNFESREDSIKDIIVLCCMALDFDKEK